jgi:hypothetical protein
MRVMVGTRSMQSLPRAAAAAAAAPLALFFSLGAVVNRSERWPWASSIRPRDTSALQRGAEGGGETHADRTSRHEGRV